VKSRVLKFQIHLAPVTVDLGGTKTMAWRTIKPMFHDEKCSQCGLCATFCPEGVIFQKEDGFFYPDYEYCKGCGICAVECAKKCIEMAREI